jgi:hypothetical protein
MPAYDWNQGEFAVFDWPIRQGSYDSFEFTVKDDTGAAYDCTGLLGRGQIRTRPGSPNLVGTLTVTLVDAEAARWRVECLPVTLASYNFGIRKSATDAVECHYDVEVYDPLDVTRVDRRVAGKALISVEATK